jgi:hypothetical protein
MLFVSENIHGNKFTFMLMISQAKSLSKFNTTFKTDAKPLQ